MVKNFTPYLKHRQLAYLFKFFSLILLTVFLNASLIAQSSLETTVYSPIADGYIRDGSFAGVNYGSDTSLVTKTLANTSISGYLRKSYLKFSFSDIVTRSETLEAEFALLNGVKTATGFPGYSGTGFADYTNSTIDYIEWTINKNNSGAATLDFRYANAGATDRPLRLEVNGVVVSPQLSFLPTGSWSTWSNTQISVNLSSGVNKVRLTAIGYSGANIDYLKWSEVTNNKTPANVVTAKLRVYGKNTESTAAINLSCFGVDDDTWTENNLTFSNAPIAGMTALSSLAINNQAQYYEFDVTDYVKAQLAADKLISLQLADPLNQDNVVAFNSKENPVNRPQLVVVTDISNTPPPGNSILFNQSSQSVEVAQGGTQSLLEYIATSDNNPVSAQLQAIDEFGNVPTWLSVNGNALNSISYTTGSEITFNFDATNLSIGSYAAKVTATATGYSNAVLDVLLTVKAGSGGTLADLKVNFQDAATITPPGWLRDYGQPFGPRTSTFQGMGNTYGWLKRSDRTPIDLTQYGRDRNTPSDVLLATLMHMQFNTATESIWEAQVANGNYDVTVSVGDASYLNSKHNINIEGVPAIVNFTPTSGVPFKSATISVTVADGLLTVDPIGGLNTKINYISIQASTTRRPSVVLMSPENGSHNVSENTSVSTSILNLPNGGIDNSTLSSSSVYLTEEATGATVPAHVNGTGGGDAITLVPNAPLNLNTSYVITITDNVKDLSGASFIPYSSSFTTSTVATGELLNVKFDRIPLPNTTGRHSSLTVGPDGKLYALSIDGVIKRFAINPDGTLGTPELIYSLQDAYGTRQSRLAIGLAFDPASTPSNPIVWITHSSFIFLNGPDWDGKLTKLSGANLQNVQDVLTNLPRSVKDHLTNSIAFGPDGALYFNQGANSAMGKADQTWGNREEHLLTAAVLRLDLTKLGSLPLDVKTPEGGGSYNPYNPNAPLTIYASGVRNAYDLVWHSNGELYVPTNGSAAGGNTPASVPGTLRPDGTTYNGPSIPALSNVQQTQKDFLFRVKQGGYYGHPNPLRGEYAMNGGNPTVAVDMGQVDAYTVGTQPDANWRGYAFDFQTNKSPNGVIEYKSNAFDGALKGKLMVVRYSQNDDILVLTPGGTNKDIVSYNEGSSIQGFTGFVDPLDLTEDVRNGNIYVSEYGGEGQIILLKPNISGTNPSNVITANPLKIYDNDVIGGNTGATKTVTITNSSQANALTVSNISLTGVNADQFVLGSLPAFPRILNPQQSFTFNVAFNPSTVGLKTASVEINSNDVTKPVISVSLRGLGTPGTGGTNEPSLQAILNLWEIPVSVGDDDPSTNVINSNSTAQKAPILGDEVSIQRFVKADAGNVTIEPLSVFGPTTVDPIVGLGWYISGDNTALNELFTVSNDPATNGQTVNVNVSGTLSFDPGTASFGFYSRWPFFSDRHLYSEDNLNTFTGSIPHHVRVYPFKNQSGIVPNTYIIAFEEHTSGFDYQDITFIVRNVKSADAPTEMMISPIADAHVRNGTYANTNYGSSTTLETKTYNNAPDFTRKPYLKFQIPDITGHILSAKLRVYGRNTENTATINISAFPVDDDSWNESTINFNNAPAAGTASLSTVSINNQEKYHEFDVTNFFKAQLEGDKVLTVQLFNQTNQNKMVTFNSKENVQNQPVLVVQTAAVAPASNTLMFVENLDRFPSNDRFVASKVQTPWTRDFVNYNANHDTVRIRINNKGINPLVVSNLQLSNPSAWNFLKLKGVDYNAATALPFTVNSGSSADLTLQFIAVNQAARVKLLVDQLIITSNDDKEPFKTLHLHGLWQQQGEGSHEPTAQEIIEAYGFKTSVGFSGTDPDVGAPSKVKGDQILSSYFVKADPSRPVYARQLAAYHQCCTQVELLRWYPKGQTGNADMRYFTGHIGLDGQSLLPRVSLPNTPAEARQNPTGAFGFRIGTLDWTDTLLNPGRKIGIRVWKALDAEGRVIPNAYIISNDYLGTDFTNYDYNDNTYFVSNIRPELGTVHYSTLSATPSAVDFDEQQLQTTPASFNLNVKNLGQTYSNGSADPVITISSVAIVGENRDEFSATLPANRNLDPQGTLSINVGFTPATEGLKTADLLIYYNNTTPLRVPLHGIGKASGTTVSVPFRIKSGSASNVVVGGKTWVSDVPYAFDNLEPYTNPQLTQISGTDEDVLYLREQSSNFDKRPFRYEMSIPNGQYWVRLHFAEIYWGTTAAPATAPTLGSRVMSVSIENELKVINLDVAQEVGTAAAYVRNIPVTVTDNKLNINFSATVNRPMVCAIEVYKFTTAPPAANPNPNIDSPQSVGNEDITGSFANPKVYPNPLNQKFFIQFQSIPAKNIELQIVDIVGRVYEIPKNNYRLDGSTIEVDISKYNLKSGVYFLKIYSKDMKTEEVVKLFID